MSHIKAVRVVLNSAGNTRSLGQEFAQTCLAPLLAKPGNPRAIIIAAYGDIAIGKTVFYHGVGDVFNISQSKWLRGSMIKRGSEHDDDRILARMRDFGAYVYGDWSSVTSSYAQRVLSPADPSFRPGLDLLEHAPLCHLERAHFVVLIGASNKMKKNAGRYFSFVNGINSLSYELLKRQKFSSAKKISWEMQRMYNLSEGRSVAPPHKYERGDQWRVTAEAGSRYVSIFPTTQDPEIISAFNDFRETVCSSKATAPTTALIHDAHAEQTLGL